MTKEQTPASWATNGGPLERLLKLDTDPSVQMLSDGVQAAYEFTPEEWLATAEAAFVDLVGKIITVDDLRRHGVPEPDIPNRWGALLASMKARGVIDLAGAQFHRTQGGDYQPVREWRVLRSPSSHDGDAA